MVAFLHRYPELDAAAIRCLAGFAAAQLRYERRHCRRKTPGRVKPTEHVQGLAGHLPTEARSISAHATL